MNCIFNAYQKFTYILIFFLFIATNFTASAKKPFTLQDAMKFRTIQYQCISEDGAWIGYSTVPDRGDPDGFIQSTNDTTKYKIERGIQPVISKNSNWSAFTVKPKAMDVDNATKDKPKEGMALLNLKSGETTNFDKIKSFSFSNDSRWLVYRPSDDKKQDTENDDNKKETGSILILRHLETGTEIDLKDVKDYLLDSNSIYLFYSVSDNDGKRDGIYYRELTVPYCPEHKINAEKNVEFSNLAWNIRKNKLAFLSSNLTKEGESIKCALWFWDASTKMLSSALTQTGVTKDWYIPPHNTLKWSMDGNRLFFGIKPEAERMKNEKSKLKFNDTTFFNPDTILLKSQVDVWNGKDLQIITSQKKNWEKEKDKYYLSVFHLDSNKFVQLADSACPDVQFEDNPSFTLGKDDTPYLKETSWDGWYHDLYLLNLNNGSRKKIASRLQENSYVSPQGKFVVFYEKSNWILYDILKDSVFNLTNRNDVVFYDEENDTPQEPNPYGFAGWTENDISCYLYDRYDIWRFYTGGGHGYMNITAGDGRINDQVFRFINLDPDKKYFKDMDSIYLYGFNKSNKTQGLYIHTTNILGIDIIFSDDNFLRVYGKAKNANKILFSKEKYNLFPDLWCSNLKFEAPKKLTNLNSQLTDFNWGKTELMKYKNSKGTELEGYFIRPDDYDPNKRYPVLMYFYERFSDMANYFMAPRANHRPCYPVYTGDGYIIFVPDIRYHIGSPGYDATDCLTSAARKLIDMGIADSNAIGIQGHSWGGYQTAFVITQTNMFKAACAGAPVGNMTSAYTGIRLESGLGRQFQYEKEQSRIGGTLWDSLDNYLKNSPVFGAKKVQTPFLLMFGDVDDAVPWYQGIELYLNLRRLNKNVIFLEYRDEPHIMKKYPNKLDYAIKMKEFFDHYLKNKPAPDWMTKGKPYNGK
jgi:dipeptidyl aminopeptidase/acylaminoacyl peptidase